MRPSAWLLRTLLGALLLGVAAGGYGGDGTAAGGKEQARLAQLQARIQRILGDLDSSRSQRQALQRELQTLERRIGDSARRLHRLKQQLAAQARRLEQLQQQRQQQQQRLQKQRELLADQVLAAYAMGRQQRLKILLNQQQPAMVSRILVYYDYLNQARMAQLRQATETLARLRGTERAIADQRQQNLQLLVEEEQERQTLEATRELRQKVVAALERDIRDKRLVLEQLQQDARRLQQLVERLRRSLPPELALEGGTRKPFRAGKGKYPWPVKGRLTARFGTRKAGNLKWDGVMIAAPEGREVKAVQGGRVAFADWLRGFGLLLIIEHGDGYMTLYGNNQSLFRETGEWVEAGEPVALVGRSGGNGNAGLYFGIRHNGRPVNPVKWCRRARNNRVG